MEVSLGFILVMLYIVLPGLVYRRFYFYGHFSKEFGAGLNLATLLAYAVVPGIFLFSFSVWIYPAIFEPINFDLIVDSIKDLFDSEFRASEEKSEPLNSIEKYVSKFTFFLFFFSWLFGLLGGRLVRISRLDTNFKLLRFKNYWFYFFRGQHVRLKNFRHLHQENRKFLFAKADVLIDSSAGNILYSGIVIDYFLNDLDCTKLSKIVLQNADRYSINDEGRRVPKPIPGAFLIVDCTSLLNINVTYVYENMGDKEKQLLRSKFDFAFSLFVLLISTLFLFKIDFIDNEIYTSYFELNFYRKVLVYLTSIQLINLLYPFQLVEGKLAGISWKMLVIKLIWFVALLSLVYFYVLD